ETEESAWRVCAESAPTRQALAEADLARDIARLRVEAQEPRAVAPARRDVRVRPGARERQAGGPRERPPPREAEAHEVDDPHVLGVEDDDRHRGIGGDRERRA